MSTGGEGQTLSLGPRLGVDRLPAVPYLFLVIQAPRPRAPAERFELAGIDEIHIGRGAARTVKVEDRRLAIAVDDGWMSSRHVVIAREAERWRLLDQRSKNGTFVRGARHREAMLLDRDVIEIGQTFFVFRAELPRSAGPIGAAPALGMTTLLPELEARFDELRRVAASKASLVLRGPSGTGKEVLARAVHELSGRRGPLVAVNCAALPETLVESELFGHVKGAFSGADRDRDGLIAASSGGTLFLDEIGDLPRGAQAKLLRVLQEQEVRPVGASTTRRVDLRVVAATHRDLARMVGEELFREDLLARLGEAFEVPPLQDRREDLGVIVASLLERIEDPRARDAAFAPETVRLLLDHPWPRNIRELQKVLERAIALAGGRELEPSHLPHELRQPRPRSAPAVVVPALSAHERTRRDDIIQLLREHGGNITAVARAMGKGRSQIQRWIKRYAIDVAAIDQSH